MANRVGVNNGLEVGIGDAAKGNWGWSGDDPLGSQNLSGDSSGQGQKRHLYDPAFNSYLQDQLSQSGALQPRSGTTTAYAKGPFAGMGAEDAYSAAGTAFDKLSDGERSKYAPPVPTQPASNPVQPPQTAQLPHEAASTQASANAYQAAGAPAATPPERLGATTFDGIGQPSLQPQPQASAQPNGAADASNAAVQRALSVGIGQSAGSGAATAPASNYAGPMAAPLGANELDPMTGRPRRPTGVV